MKIRPLGAMVFHVERRTDGQTERRTTTMHVRVVLRNFTKASKTEGKKMEMSHALQTGDPVGNKAKFETTCKEHIRQWTARIDIFI
jgi:hypothetical protein